MSVQIKQQIDSGTRIVDHIVPRWEWRTFGEDFGQAERQLGRLTPISVQRSSEIYLLANGSDANVKYRDDLLDIKQLECVDNSGLERWRPVFKKLFPLSASDVAQVRSALGLPTRRADGGATSIENLLAGLRMDSLSVQAIHVEKTRARFHLHECAAELTEVIADGRKTRTIAFEGEDSAKVSAAVHAIGLDGLSNTCYPRGLKQLLGDAVVHAIRTDGLPDIRYPKSRQAVIDVGTNSVKFHVAELTHDGIWKTIVDRAEVTRLGEGIQNTGAIATAAMERTSQAIKGMTAEAACLGVEEVTAVGTMGLRTAANSPEFLDLVKNRCGVAIQVISGDQECQIAYRAARTVAPATAGAVVVFDTGGGSSQFTFGKGDHVDSQFSINVGAVRYTDQFHLDRAVTPDVLREALAAIDSELGILGDHMSFTETSNAASEILARLRGTRPPTKRPSTPDSLIGMGGAVTNITAVMLGLTKYDRERVQGATIDRTEIARQIELYGGKSAEERRQIVGLQPKRAEVILAGACIVGTIMDKLKQSSLIVSDRGLRHGILIERFGGRLS